MPNMGQPCLGVFDICTHLSFYPQNNQWGRCYHDLNLKYEDTEAWKVCLTIKAMLQFGSKIWIQIQAIWVREILYADMASSRHRKY